MMGGNLLKRKSKRNITIAVIAAAFLLIFITQYKNIIGSFFPIKYKDIVVKYSKMYHIDPYLTFALINVESHYKADAESNRDAKGLMQITVSTGKWAAGRMGIKDYNESMLYDPETNIHMGCWYLDNIRKEFELEDNDSDTILMLAAYNGGSGNVKSWLSDKEYSETGTTLNQIPFTETKQYVEKVLRDYKMYKWLYPNI